MSGQLERCEREWHELEGEFQELQETHRIYRQKLEELTSLQTLCSGSINKQKTRLKDLKHTLQRYKSHASREEAELIQQMSANIKDRQNIFFDMEAYLPKKNGLYLNLVLGNVNVTLLSNQAKFAYKDEYEKFKLYLTIILLLGAVACRFVLHYRVTDEVFNFLLVWYYCTLTIRESILISNGSRLCPVPAILLPEGLPLQAARPGGEESPGPHRGRIPVLDVAGPHLPSAFPVLWPCESPGVCGYPLFWADPWEQKVLRPLPHSPAVPELSIPQGPGADMAPVCALCSGMLRQEPAVACSTSILSPRSSGCSGLVDTRSWGPGPPPGLPHVGLQGNPMG
ncbi:transmembrane protein 120B isoform X3 [Canis lupus dingo]|uniref:transmembrane protein 120B isoform X3 n=1 Tax=Canis lupus dingo TaxID=286419 RepID=UPI0003AE76CD|nr:transmembrane protein 120B isoform X3 [Canis lupus dingo]